MSDIDRTYEQIIEIARNHDVQELILFGSRARGDAFEKSDIDLAVRGCSDFMAFRDDLQENLWSLLSVDVVDLDAGVSQVLAEDIRRDGKVLYEKI